MKKRKEIVSVSDFFGRSEIKRNSYFSSKAATEGARNKEKVCGGVGVCVCVCVGVCACVCVRVC